MRAVSGHAVRLFLVLWLSTAPGYVMAEDPADKIPVPNCSPTDDPTCNDQILAYIRAGERARHPDTTSCTCPDGRQFQLGDTVIFHAEWENNALRTGKLTRLQACYKGVIDYPHYWISVSGKVKKGDIPDQQLQENVCLLMKPMRRSAITKALTADLSNAGAKSVHQNGNAADSSDDASATQKPPESGNLLEGQNLARPDPGGLPGGFHVGEYVFVPKEMHVHGRHIPRETMGRVVGTGGKHGEKIRVAFVETSKGRFMAGLLLSMAIGPMSVYVPYAKSPQHIVEVLINPENLMGISVPVIF